MARCIALLLGSSRCWALGNLEKWGEEKAGKTRKYGSGVAVVGFVLWMRSLRWTEYEEVEDEQLSLMDWPIYCFGLGRCRFVSSRERNFF
jgi:hypothetical protein